MEKIIDTAALIDAVKILLWDRSKSREEMIELAVALIEEAGEELVHCKDCKKQIPYSDDGDFVNCYRHGMVMKKNRSVQLRRTEGHRWR